MCSSVTSTLLTARSAVEIEDIDEGAQALSKLLSGPDLRLLQGAPLPASTKAFVVRRWRRSGHDGPVLEEAETFLDALACIEAIEGESLLEEIGDWTATALLTRVSRMTSERRAFNLVVTTVPGPPVPLYL